MHSLSKMFSLGVVCVCILFDPIESQGGSKVSPLASYVTLVTSIVLVCCMLFVVC